MIFAMFAVGTFWLWALITVSVVLLFLCIEYESGFKATSTILMTGVVLWLFGNFNPFLWCFHNPLFVLGGAVAYFIVGLLWVLFKWEVFSRDRLSGVQEHSQEYFGSHPKPTV